MVSHIVPLQALVLGAALVFLYDFLDVPLGKPPQGRCVMIYETGYSTPMAALRFIHSKDRDGNPIKKVEFWTSTECWDSHPGQVPAEVFIVKVGDIGKKVHILPAAGRG